jgi:hypothetical protein
MMSLTFHDKKKVLPFKQTNKKENEVAILDKIAVASTKILTFRWKLRRISRVIWKTLNCFGTQSQLIL